jgi:hypothetical protein
MILWHDSANGRVMRWAHNMDEGAGVVDIAAQMKSSLKSAEDETTSDD